LKPEELGKILKSNISFHQFLKDQVDLDEIPRELDGIDEGFDSLEASIKEIIKRQDE
jgi:hypothetical protein